MKMREKLRTSLTQPSRCYQVTLKSDAFYYFSFFYLIVCVLQQQQPQGLQAMVDPLSPALLHLRFGDLEVGE